jgi:hypothetical protein
MHAAMVSSAAVSTSTTLGARRARGRAARAKR